MRFVAAIILAGLPLLLVEVVSRIRHIKPELSRKLAHVLSSVVTCFFPSFLSLKQIAIIGCIFFIALVSTRFLRIWKSLYGIDRSSLGELWFPLGVSAAALLASDSKQFICAILIMGISDSVAALVGQHYGKRLVKVPFQKSVEGSLAFLICSIIILKLVLPLLGPLNILLIAAVLTVAEFISPYGADNITVPVLSVIFTNIYL